ncbi:RIBULOSE-phosphate 3-epimerase [Naganishia albida]|nr:RIBULOSE-phosphate 3-epimerase [Naganishia albida]
MAKAIISPSVLASDLSNLTQECKRMIAEGADWLHMDVMDGHFVPNITMGAPILSCVKKGVPEIFMDCHMMVADPIKWVPAVAEAGGKLYTFHLEAVSDPLPVINEIHSHNMLAGLAISPQTPASRITDAAFAAADMILVMTVHPGKGGQKFMPECLEKVKELRARFGWDKDVQVDGGVGPGNICQCAQAGSNVIVAGTSVFSADKPAEVISTLRKAVDDAIAERRQKQ